MDAEQYLFLSGSVPKAGGVRGKLAAADGFLSPKAQDMTGTRVENRSQATFEVLPGSERGGMRLLPRLTVPQLWITTCSDERYFQTVSAEEMN